MSTWWKDEGDLVGEQIEILDFSPEHSILIQGPPGSGKTNLLLLRANYLALGDHPDIRVVVFGSLLRTFIQIGGVQYKFPSDRVTTHARLFDDILRENGVWVDTRTMDLETARASRANGVEMLLKTGKITSQFDALLLDEAQDYTSQEIRIFAALAPVLIATADEHQKVYKGDNCFGELKAAVDTQHSLKYHFRNGRDICRIADAIMHGQTSHKSLTENAQYDENAYPVTIAVTPGLSTTQQAEAIAEQLGVQLVTYPEEKIGILCPKNEAVQEIADHLSSLGFGSQITICKSSDFDPDAPIWLSSISAAKGLEFRCVHLAGLESLSNMGSAQKRLAYTGVTRAKTALSFYYNERIPAYLESAIRVVKPVSKAITRDRIFGKG